MVQPYIYSVRTVFLWVVVAACGSSSASVDPPGEVSEFQEPPVEPPPREVAEARRAPEPEPITCAEPLPIYEDGEAVGTVCPERLEERGLTALDLSDDWAPLVFLRRDDPNVAEVEYRSTFLALANDDYERAERGFQFRHENYLELYGVFPSFAVLRRRAEREAVAECVGQINSQAIANLQVSLGPWRGASRGNRARALQQRLEREASRRNMESIQELADHSQFGRMLQQYEEERRIADGVAAVQQHLACEGELSGNYSEGSLGGTTVRALVNWQRKHMIVSNGGLDETTRDRMALGVRELLFQAMLRALRERVVDTTGLIEDGSAVAEYGTVFGRHLDPPQLMVLAERGPFPHGVHDLISPATEAAAQALGWTDPDRAIASLRALDTSRMIVAVRLPPLPPHHSSHMDLRAEVDRGDVRRVGVARESDRRPTVTVFTEHGGSELALFRWSTTIGGWQPEQLEDGSVVRRYKESPVGERIWRDVIAAPAWLPPPSTPDGELVRGSAEHGYRPQYELFGPSYRSAYGLLMVMHHRVLGENNDGELLLHDEGIRTHGSVSYRSMLTGHSHGCHRVFNHLALRLGGFLLRHRNHIQHGDLNVQYARVVRPDEDHELTIRLRSRGHLYELTPPVPVNVLEGTVHETPSWR